MVLCDLDGVVWLSHEPIEGSVDAIERLRSTNRRVLFVTNNSSAPIADHEAALAAIGIDARGEVVSSAMAAAELVDRHERVLVVAGPGVHEAVTARGAVAVGPRAGDATRVDAVVVGFHRDFDYEAMRIATTAVQQGARLIGTNDDPTYPTPDGPIPGGGAILASIVTATGATPTIAGKPNAPMARAVAARLAWRTMQLSVALVVGDRPDTDGLFARTLGADFALVRSGVTAPGSRVDVDASLDAADLAAIAGVVTGTGG